MAKRSVLLVEDDDSLRLLYKEAFLHHAFKVYEANNGQLAVDYAIIYSPDAIVLDLMMPRQGGIGALRIFRSIPECKHTPIVILTALSNPEYKELAEGKVQGYFLKTQVQPAQLVEHIRSLIV